MSSTDPFANSGTNLEVEIAQKLRNDGWLVKTKQHYLDPFEKKPREIDIISSKKIEISDRFSAESVSFEYGVIIADNSQKIFLRRDGQKQNDNFIRPILFGIDYVNTSGRSVFFLVDVISLDQLDDFLLEKSGEFDLLKKEIYAYDSWEKQRMSQEFNSGDNPY